MQDTSLSGSLRRLTVPDHAPPYDDQLESVLQPVLYGNAPLDQSVACSAEPHAAAGDAAGMPSAAPAQVRPGQASAAPPGAVPEGALAAPAAAWPAEARSAPPVNLAGGAGAGPWPSRFAQVLAETLAGARPARQLTPWTSEQARQRIRQLGQTVACDQRPTVRRIMTSAPAEDVLELTAVVGFGPRVRVLALRLERLQHDAGVDGGGQWCCTTIESA